MQCPTCGSRNKDIARFCANCGQGLRGTPYQPYRESGVEDYGGWEGYPVDVSNYLAQSILVTIFCCLPLGIAAIIFAAQVNGKVASGDLAGAQSASGTAKTLCWVSFIGGLLVIGGWLFVFAVIAPVL